MTPKEKAIDIYLSMGNVIQQSDLVNAFIETPFGKDYVQKQCALIVVDEVLGWCRDSWDDYFIEVKREIEKL